MTETNEKLTSLSEQLDATKVEFEAAKTELEQLRETVKLQEGLKSTMDAQETKLAEQEKQINGLLELNNMLRLHEQVSEFLQLSEHEDKIISPAYEEAIIGLMLQLDGPESEKELLALIEAMAVGDAVVPLGERGTDRVPASLEEGSKDDGLKLHKAAMALSEERNIKYREALIEVQREAQNG